MSIKNIYDEISSFDNVLSAERNVRAGSRSDKEQLLFFREYEDNIHYIVDSLKSLNFPPDRYRSFYVYEPKLRKIICSDYITKVIQRAAYDVLNPRLCKGFINDTYSCIKGRGQLEAMYRLSEWVDYVSRNGGKWYYLKMDVEKFFYRIDHKVLMGIISKKISDRRTVRFMERYICEASRPFGLPLGVKNPMDIPENEMLWEVGITIGGGLSHMHGNMYLDPMDQLAKRSMKITFYIRYMDDVIVLSDSKDELHRYEKEFSDFLGDVLKLRLNNKTAIRPVSQGIEFVGFQIKPGNVRIRKSTSLRMKRHLKDVREKYRNYEISFEEANQTVQSYIALMDKCDCKELKDKILGELVFTHNPKEVIG